MIISAVFLWISRSRKYHTYLSFLALRYFFLEDCPSRQACFPWSRLNSRSLSVSLVSHLSRNPNFTPLLEMLLPKGGVTWKSTKAHLPPSRAILHLFTRVRFPLFLALAALLVILWRGFHLTAREMQR